MILVGDKHHLVVVRRPRTGEDGVLAFEQLPVVDHFAPHVHGHGGTAHAEVLVERRHHLGRIDGEVRAVLFFVIHLRLHAVAVLHRRMVAEVARVALDILAERHEIIFPVPLEDSVGESGQLVVRVDIPVLRLKIVLPRPGERREHRREIHRLPCHLDRIGGQCIFLYFVDENIDSVRQCENQRDPDDSDRPREGGEEGARLFGH